MHLKKGINLGGFLSQCCHTYEHYDEFIKFDDIKKISEWGFDHVRLPIDYEVFEEEDGQFKKKGFEKVEEIIKWCVTCKLNIIIDLHKAYGYDFNDAGDTQKNTLFTSVDLQNRFIKLWKEIVLYFGKYDNIAFELLNEVVEKENAEAWNCLIHQTVNELRKINKKAPIIYGGIQWNSIKTLKLLNIPTEKNIIFTFHFYEPLLFTHQKAPWVAAMDPEETIFYPASMDYYKAKSQKLGYQGEVVTKSNSYEMGQEFIKDMVEEAVQVAKTAGVSLYCGEFGVIDRALVNDTLRWYTDVNKVFRKYHIGYAVWSYKEMDFGITEEHYAPIRDELISLWCK